MKTKRSILAFVFQLFGWIVIILINPLFLFLQLKMQGTFLNDALGANIFLGAFAVLASLLTGIGIGAISIFIGNLIQKVWNMESYLKVLAENSNPVISDYPSKRYEGKPIEALKAAVKPPTTPKDDDDDVSKYAPK